MKSASVLHRLRLRFLRLAWSICAAQNRRRRAADDACGTGPGRGCRSGARSGADGTPTRPQPTKPRSARTPKPTTTPTTPATPRPSPRSGRPTPSTPIPTPARKSSAATQLEKYFTEALTDNDTKLTVDVTSVDFVSPNVAIERGVAHVISPDGEVEDSAYSAVHVRQDGQWLLDRVTEEGVVKPPKSNYEHLKELEWMVGSWIDEDEDVTDPDRRRVDQEQELPHPLVLGRHRRPGRHVRHADHRLGSGRQADPLVGVRLRRRIRRRQVERQGRPLGHPVLRHAARRRQDDRRQHHDQDRRQLVRLAVDQSADRRTRFCPTSTKW